MDLVKDRTFTVTKEIVGYGASPWEGKKTHKERGGEPLWVQLQYSESTRRIVS